MWHNFGGEADDANCRRICYTAFDLGITHFDLANNYGPPPGSAEERAGKIIRDMPRDELIISSKAGWVMWPGPYGNLGSRKYLLASLDQSLQRLGLDYVDIFYHHRPDPLTPMEESLGALDQAVRSGKALYAGISSYNGKMTDQAAEIVAKNRLAPLLIHQPYYNMLSRGIEHDLLPATERHGLGVIAFCPLARYVGRMFWRRSQRLPRGFEYRLPQEGTGDPESLVKPRKLAKIAKATRPKPGANGGVDPARSARHLRVDRGQQARTGSRKRGGAEKRRFHAPGVSGHRSHHGRERLTQAIFDGGADEFNKSRSHSS